MSRALLIVALVTLPLIAKGYEYTLINDAIRNRANSIIAAATAPANQTDVYDRIAQMADDYGPRFSGSDSLEAALDWMIATATAEGKTMGYTVKSEPAMVPRWIRGNEWATMQTSTRNQTLSFVGLGMSNGTNGTTVTGPLIVVQDRDDLKARSAKGETAGKVCLFNVPFTTYGKTVQYRSNAANWGAEVGCIAALIRSVSTYSIQNPHTGTSNTGPIPAGSVSLEHTDQMQRQFDRDIPMTVSIYMDAHQLTDRESKNVIFEIPGQSKPDEFVVFGGHTDSWAVGPQSSFDVGVMDDGASVVASWNAIRILASLGIKVARTIRAVGWVNEENGSRGAGAYAKAHAAELNKTSFAFETDEGPFSPWTLGVTSGGHEAAFNQLYVLRGLLDPISAGNITKGGGGEDISPMCEAGVPCAGVVVRDFRATDYANNPCRDILSTADYADKTLGAQGGIPDGYFWFHHSSGDSMRTVDPDQLQILSAFLAVWGATIADLPELLPRSGPVPPLPKSTTGNPADKDDDDDNEGRNDAIIAVGIIIFIGAAVAVGCCVFRTKKSEENRVLSAGGGGEGREDPSMKYDLKDYPAA